MWRAVLCSFVLHVQICTTCTNVVAMLVQKLIQVLQKCYCLLWQAVANHACQMPFWKLHNAVMLSHTICLDSKLPKTFRYDFRCHKITLLSVNLCPKVLGSDTGLESGLLGTVHLLRTATLPRCQRSTYVGLGARRQGKNH